MCFFLLLYCDLCVSPILCVCECIKHHKIHTCIGPKLSQCTYKTEKNEIIVYFPAKCQSIDEVVIESLVNCIFFFSENELQNHNICNKIPRFLWLNANIIAMHIVRVFVLLKNNITASKQNGSRRNNNIL